MFPVHAIDALIPLCAGIYGTYLAFRGVPAGTQKPLEWQEWYARYGRWMKIGGPMLILVGLIQLIIKTLA